MGNAARARIGILGGTFDPIHRGHLDVARAARDALRLEEVWLVPSHIPPHRAAPPGASPFHRFAMVALAAAESGAEWLRACDLELSHEGPSYTTTTLRRVEESGHERSQIFFLTGADAFAEIATWRDYPGILDRAHFVIVSRPGWPVTSLRGRLPALAARMIEPGPNGGVPPQPSILLLDAKTADISSTEIRERLASGRPLDGHVPDAVERHAVRHGLYRA
ncbi:MAG TPA: nicotinate-nucleotide adenylyltransferase [Vicinamibacterales bacterium]|nr:nicotinate-nucleotide adenylyltransferase [Vicinamibacterales bacterium]